MRSQKESMPHIKWNKISIWLWMKTAVIY